MDKKKVKTCTCGNCSGKQESFYCFTRLNPEDPTQYTFQFIEKDEQEAINTAKKISPNYTEVIVLRVVEEIKIK